MSIAQSNPFEVQGRVPKASFTDTIMRNDSSKNALSSSKANDEAVKQSAFDANYLKLKSENPFEVNHVPLVGKNIPKIGQIELDIKPKLSNGFIFWIMLFSWGLLALVLTNRNGIIGKLTRSLFNENMLKLTKRQDGERLSIHFIMMYLVYFINASVFIYLLVKHYSKIASNLYWFYMLVGLIILYLGRHIILSFIGWLFPLEKEASLFSFTIMIINLLLGLFLIPVNLILAFGPENLFIGAMYFGIIVFGFAFIIRYVRGFFISANHIFNHLFLFFIYLCVIEIAPVLIGIRFITNNIQ